MQKEGAIMNRQEFMQQLQPIIPPEGIRQVSHAYWLAKEMHRKQVRDGKIGMNMVEILLTKFLRAIGSDLRIVRGERYFEHCRRVAIQVVCWGSHDADEVTSALLHDCIEDCYPPQDLLEGVFPKHVVQAVETLSKVTRVFDECGAIIKKRKKSAEEYWGGIREAPVWVRRVKLADRLDNLRSMHVWQDARKQKYLLETETYILPIARMTDERFCQDIVLVMREYKK
ncbi:MAG: hypothetical protein A3I44_05085 [Candidatus Sungbacteria bacterium RIFCSPLOWO2_02_FULL_51_17]|nr:MAG: hypothetical protein A2676_05190 [Candidatus Sungbacteria bacterium RIFCSPHIGHO2_01_FULL_51_22]OHA07018.1 MAG: hypothetical protein A3B29_01150 [Candidatus Sungbacteria bacterium RIFCSPLOWO2_01_FULL_51_34]OHA11792.1 MAG: hypothetical protein A3I44_05085 [Candidatus Sungbacteria bacterium RIFCSPLOWO2_02_FULL_51_17]